MTGFPFRLAWRETRREWRHFVGFLACITLGVGALVGVQGLAGSLEGTLAREGKTLMGGDLELRSARPLDRATEDRLGRIQASGGTLARVRELVGMARDPGDGKTLLVELKAIDLAYPLYGRLETTPARPVTELLGPDGALVQDTLLTRLRLGVGARLTIGQATFTITGVVRREPDRAAGIGLGPRVLLSAAGLDRTGLVQLGSRVRYRTLVRLAPTLDAAAARERLAREVADPAVRVASFDEAQPGLRRFFGQATTYLGLVGLTSLLVGGIGVAAGVRTFLATRLHTIAVLKAVGASSRVIFQAYLGQTLALGTLGTLAGIALGAGVQRLLASLLSPFVPFAIETRLPTGAAFRGLLVGLMTTLLCALWPLARIRAVRPALLLHQAVSAERLPTLRALRAAVPVALGLGALVLWQAGSLRLGGIFLAAAAAAIGLLSGLARGLRRLARRLPRMRALAWRQGLAGLDRPGSQAIGVVVALGAGVMVLVAVAVLERSLARQLDLESRREAPSFFFVDLQPDQADAFTRTVAAVDRNAHPTLIPVVRARLVAINGQPIVRHDWEGREDAWRVTREYVLTFAASPPAGTVLTRGRWWTPAEAAARPRISVEDEAARALGLGLGGTLTFDVQGVPVEAEVESLRKVDWQALSANFFVIFSPGALEQAPLTYLATTRVPAAAEAGLQDTVTARFPNVTAIPVRDILDRVAGVLERIGVAIRLIGLFVVGAGLTVMAGALTASRAQRLYESVLLRTLGARRGQVARIFAVEYGVLGLAAGIGGTLLGAVLAASLLRFVLDLPWRFDPGTLALGVGLTVVLALAVGFLGTFRLLGQKPLPVLRRE